MSGWEWSRVVPWISAPELTYTGQASSSSRVLSRLLCHSYLIQSADSSLTSPTHEPYSFTQPLFKSFCRREFPHFLLSHTCVLSLPHLPPSRFSSSVQSSFFTLSLVLASASPGLASKPPLLPCFVPPPPTRKPT